MSQILSSTVFTHAQRLLSEKIGSAVEIKKFTAASGGCINESGTLETNCGRFFVKWNSAEKYPGMFRAEAKGLTLLRKQDKVYVPKVIAWHQSDATQILLLSFFDNAPPKAHYWKKLGEGLALLHHQTNDVFGLDHDNYIGSLPQQNKSEGNWLKFFIKRLQNQLALAMTNGYAETRLTRQFQALFEKLPEVLVTEKPSLLHGDLWRGNIMSHEGEPAFIDPAVYYGNREADIAMTMLFGGFHNDFYDSYNFLFPLESNWRQRLEIYNLYPLMVHLNLFGRAYYNQVSSILQKYV